MELKQLFNVAGTLYKVVTRKNGDEFTDGYFESAFEACKCANDIYSRLSDYDKSKNEVAVQKFEIENVIDCDCDLEDETSIEHARNSLVFNGYDETIINREV